MKKTLVALMTAACLAMTPAAAFAEDAAETESSVMALQGVDDQSNIWTVALDTESERGSVCIQVPDEDGTYPEENYVLIAGALQIADDSMTITDDEDGQDYYFGMQSVEGDTVQVDMTYEPTGSVVILSLIDQETIGADENMTYYAGVDENGDQWTVGFDWENSAIAINVMTAEGSNTVGGIFEDDEAGTLTITTEDGSTETLTYEPINGDWSTLALTDESGTTITVSYINPEILNVAA